MYKYDLQKIKEDNIDEEYTDLYKIIDELILDGASNEKMQQHQQGPQTPLTPLRKSVWVSQPIEIFTPTFNYVLLAHSSDLET